ncbi:MAG TPA: PilZ domain-containing protein [bacterium]|nr:PilZ domain-containing protein [bacterium]
MSEREQVQDEASAEEARSLEMETLPHGRYIPYSGGSMGWFENQGVLHSERGNNYHFREVMESEYVRAALFQRWGQVTDQRAARRIARENSVNVLMSDEAVPETAFQLSTEEGVLAGRTKNVSHYGMRMQFDRDPHLSRGKSVKVQLLGGDGSDVVLDLPAKVIWVKREMYVRPVWFVGVAFLQLTADTESFFSEFLER